MRALILAGAAAVVLALSAPAHAAGKAGEVKHVDWSFAGLFGTFDRGALQRGFQVYKEVCSTCHGMRLLSYRNLVDIGFTEDQVKAVAAEYEVTDGPNDEGEMFERAALPQDRFKSPFPNEEAARASNNGAYPVDLSLIAKARENGSNYVYSLLTGYREEAPAGVTVPDGMNYNKAFAGNMIAMANPLFEDGVEYADGTKASVDQMAKDVTTFLTWAASPELEDRKQMGIKVILFLILLTGMLYAVKRRIWADVH